MNCFWKGILTFWLALLIAGCGGSGASTGTAHTVAVTVACNNMVFAHHSSNRQFVVNGVSATLTSTPLFSTLSKTPISSVNVIGASTRLIPLPMSGSSELSTAIPHPQFANNPAIGGLIPGPGTLEFTGIPIFGALDADVATQGLPLTPQQFNYTAILTFNLKESNTGNVFSVSTPVGVIYDTTNR